MPSLVFFSTMSFSDNTTDPLSVVSLTSTPLSPISRSKSIENYLSLIRIAFVSTLLLNRIDKRFIGLQLISIHISLILPLFLPLLQSITILLRSLKIILQLVVIHLQFFILSRQTPQFLDQLFRVRVIDRMKMLFHLVVFLHLLRIVSS